MDGDEWMKGWMMNGWKIENGEMNGGGKSWE